jgi:hypothetical protein
MNPLHIFFQSFKSNLAHLASDEDAKPKAVVLDFTVTLPSHREVFGKVRSYA